MAKASTVAEYLASLPADRRAALEAVRTVIKKNLDADYEEGMQYGMIGYYVPHRVFPAGYHCDPKQPLPFAALASQKGGMSLHLMGLYIGPEGKEPPEADDFRTAWTKTGRKLDMGKACVRFKKLEDVALDVLGDTIRRLPVKLYVARYSALDPRGAAAAAKKSVAGAATKAKPAIRAKPAARAATKSKPAARPAAKKKAAKRA